VPVYEYVCTHCGTRFDKLCRLAAANEAQQAICPNCGASANKTLSRFAVASSSGSYEADNDIPVPKHPDITPKEDIERWRREYKREHKK